MILYHYTTKESYDEIVRTEELIPSTPWTTMDAYAGDGWYFTDLTPSNSDITIAEHCWLDTSPATLLKVECYLKFDIDVDELLKNTRPHVYMMTKDTIREGMLKLINYTNKNKKVVIKYITGGRKPFVP